MKRIILFIVTCLYLNTGWTLRCHGQLVYEGDSQETVLKKCGEPKDKELLSTTQTLYNSDGVQYGAAPFRTEIWTYQSSPQDFIYHVHFTDRVVTSISSGLRE